MEIKRICALFLLENFMGLNNVEIPTKSDPLLLNVCILSFRIEHSIAKQLKNLTVGIFFAIVMKFAIKACAYTGQSVKWLEFFFYYLNWFSVQKLPKDRTIFQKNVNRTKYIIWMYVVRHRSGCRIKGRLLLLLLMY